MRPAATRMNATRMVSDMKRAVRPSSGAMRNFRGASTCAVSSAVQKLNTRVGFIERQLFFILAEAMVSLSFVGIWVVEVDELRVDRQCVGGNVVELSDDASNSTRGFQNPHLINGRIPRVVGTLIYNSLHGLETIIAPDSDCACDSQQVGVFSQVEPARAFLAG